MAVYEALLLNTVVPQIQAAQAGDSYVMVVNATTPALRITQTGTGDSILVEDSANPDSSPFVVTAAGDVGIGTSSPVEKLHVQSSSNAIGSFRSSGASYVGVETVNSSRSYSMLVRPDVSNALVIRDETVSSNRITLDTSGRLGIGITSPAYTLDVTGSTSTARLGKLTITNDSPFVTGANIDAGANSLALGTSGAGIVAFFSNNTERARITSGGDFGIGISSPGTKLDVAGTIRSNVAGGTPILYLHNGTTQHSIQNTSGALTFFNDGIERARITSGGNFQTSSGGSVQVGGTAARATTAGTNRVDIFDGTAPVGTLANGVSFYSTAGEARVMDAAGNATLLSPHDTETNEWIFHSKHTPSGKVLKIDVEKMLRFINDHFGLDAIHEFTEE
jgi:hypothetical protein